VSQINNDNVDQFKDCTVIEGSTTILDSTFTGYHDMDETFSFSRQIPPMAPEKLEVFSTLKEITGYMNIQGDHKNFTSLSFLRYVSTLRDIRFRGTFYQNVPSIDLHRNLEIIGGRELTQSYFASLYIVKTSLHFLGLTSLKKIHSGGVAILENEHLCYTEGLNWTKIKKSLEHHTPASE